MYEMHFKTTAELYNAFYDAQEDTSIGVVFCQLKGLRLKMGCIHFVAVEIKTHVIKAMWRGWTTSFEYT
jgi:hypothetical protein